MKVPYLAEGEVNQSRLLGSRSAASTAAVWASLKHLGRAGYVAVVERCLELTWRLIDGIQKIDGLEL